MKPIDLRNETWADVEARVTEARAAMYELLNQHGPCTVRELSAKCGVEILSVAPRICELYQLGLVELVGKDGTRGVYAAVDRVAARQAFEQRKAIEMGQLHLNLKQGA